MRTSQTENAKTLTERRMTRRLPLIQSDEVVQQPPAGSPGRPAGRGSHLAAMSLGAGVLFLFAPFLQALTLTIWPEATIGLVLAVALLVLMMAAPVAAIVLGIRSRRELRREGSAARRWMAAAGIVLGIFGLGLMAASVLFGALGGEL